jgi:glycerol-3-phosphate dehydrogenase
MQRNLSKLSQQVYDLVIVGGGIYGAIAFWDATLRGLSVALIEKGDFGGATSSNSSKIGHGGLRYLQHADFKRMRESIRARTTLMRIAPHLVYYQPYLMPTYGHGVKGREVMAIAMKLNDLISIDRKWVKDPSKRIPDTKTISKKECLRLVPGIKKEKLSGGAIWYDGQMVNTERLLLSFVFSAVQHGGHAANYAEVIDFLGYRNSVSGVHVRDVLTGNTFDVQARMVLNMAGPWVQKVMNFTSRQMTQPRVALSKAFTIVTRPLTKDFALAMYVKPMYQDKNSLVNKGANLIFAIPWRKHSMIGSLHLPYNGDPDHFQITEDELQAFIDQINEAHPPAKLTREDVLYVFSGMVPSTAPGSSAPLKHHHIFDHEKEDDIKGLISVVGVKYTTARNVAEEAINEVFEKLDRKSPACRTARRPIMGGNIPDFQKYLYEQIEKNKSMDLSEGHTRRLIRNYGTRYPDVLKYISVDPRLAETLTGAEVLKAEIVHSIHNEMAQRLSDLVFRRTEIGTLGYPGEVVIRECAEIMAQELGWNQNRMELEIKDTDAFFAAHLAKPALGNSFIEKVA